jgi:hypothetical protein
MFENVLSPVELTTGTALLCALLSLLLGALTGLAHGFRNSTNRNFIITLAVLPFIVETVIMVVNGNVGTGIAVMGAFSLVRFRSVPGTSREIVSIFMSMAIGLLTGAGHIVFAIVFTLVANGGIMLFVALRFGEGEARVRYLKITIPEDLDYTTVFEDIFAAYTVHASLERVRTANLGTLYELRYAVTLKDVRREKELLDKIRMRNSNLDISCSRIRAAAGDEL